MGEKYLDLLKYKDRRDMMRHRIENCPFPKSCCPVSFHISSINQAGVCAGLIYKSPNLDCIRHCIFFVDGKTKKLDYLEHFMTPDEAADSAGCLMMAVRASLDFASSYQNYHEQLCKDRDDGDLRPADM